MSQPSTWNLGANLSSAAAAITATADSITQTADELTSFVGKNKNALNDPTTFDGIKLGLLGNPLIDGKFFSDFLQELRDPSKPAPTKALIDKVIEALVCIKPSNIREYSNHEELFARIQDVRKAISEQTNTSLKQEAFISKFDELFLDLRKISTIPDDLQGMGLLQAAKQVVTNFFSSGESTNYSLKAGRGISHTLIASIGFFESQLENQSEHGMSRDEKEKAARALYQAKNSLQNSLNAKDTKEWGVCVKRAMEFMDLAPIVSIEGVEIPAKVDPGSGSNDQSISSLQRAGRVKKAKTEKKEISENEKVNSRASLIHVARQRTVYQSIVSLYSLLGGKNTKSFSEITKGILYDEGEELNQKMFKQNPENFKKGLSKESTRFFVEMEAFLSANDNGLSEASKTLLSWLVLPLIDSTSRAIFHYVARTVENLSSKTLLLGYFQNLNGIAETAKDGLDIFTDHYELANNKYKKAENGNSKIAILAEELHNNDTEKRRGKTSTQVHREFSMLLLDQLPQLDVSSFVLDAKEKVAASVGTLELEASKVQKLLYNAKALSAELGAQIPLSFIYYFTFIGEKLISETLRGILKLGLFAYDPIESTVFTKSKGSSLSASLQNAMNTSLLHLLEEANDISDEEKKKSIERKKKMGATEKTTIFVPLLQNWLNTTTVYSKSQNKRHLRSHFERLNQSNSLDILYENAENWVCGAIVDSAQEVMHTTFDKLLESDTQNEQSFKIFNKLRQQILFDKNEENHSPYRTTADLESAISIEQDKLMQTALNQGSELVRDQLMRRKSRETTKYIEWMQEQVIGVLIPAFEKISLDGTYEDQKENLEGILALYEKFGSEWGTMQTNMRHVSGESKRKLEAMFTRFTPSIENFKSTLAQIIRTQGILIEFERLGKYVTGFNKKLAETKPTDNKINLLSTVRMSIEATILELEETLRKTKMHPLRDYSGPVIKQMEATISQLKTTYANMKEEKTHRKAVVKFSEKLDSYHKAIESKSTLYGYLPIQIGRRISTYEHALYELELSVQQLPNQWKEYFNQNGTIRDIPTWAKNADKLSSEELIYQVCKQKSDEFTENLKSRRTESYTSLTNVATLGHSFEREIQDQFIEKRRQEKTLYIYQSQMVRTANGTLTLSSISDHDVGLLRAALSSLNTDWEQMINSTIRRDSLGDRELSEIITLKSFTQNLQHIQELLPKIDSDAIPLFTRLKEICNTADLKDLKTFLSSNQTYMVELINIMLNEVKTTEETLMDLLKITQIMSKPVGTDEDFSKMREELVKTPNPNLKRLEKLRAVLEKNIETLTEKEVENLTLIQKVLTLAEATQCLTQQEVREEFVESLSTIQDAEMVFSKMLFTLEDLSGMHPLSYAPLDPLKITNLLKWLEWVIFSTIKSHTGASMLTAQNPVLQRVMAEKFMQDITAASG